MQNNLDGTTEDGVVVTSYLCTLVEFKSSRTLAQVCEVFDNYSRSSISRMISNKRKIGVYLDEKGGYRLGEFKWLTPENTK